MNPNLGASARALQDWILLGRTSHVKSSVALRADGDLRRWLNSEHVPSTLNRMTWPDRGHLLASGVDAWRMAGFFADHGTAILHCYEHDLYPFAVVLRWLTRLPLVCHVHFRVGRRFAEWAFGARWKRPDALIWTSQQQAHDCAAAVDGIVSRDRQHVIPLGLDVTRFVGSSGGRELARARLGLSPSDIVIGAAAALRERKRIDDFLALVRELHTRHPNVIGLLAGGEVPGDEDFARTIIPRLRAEEATGSFRWLGHLEPIAPFMQAVDVFVSTSEYETHGMSVLEAMASARPVVAYRGGSVHETVGDGGRVVSDGDMSALVSAAESMVVDPQLRAKVGLAAQRRVLAMYTPGRGLSDLTRIYSTLSKGAKGRRRPSLTWSSPTIDPRT